MHLFCFSASGIFLLLAQYGLASGKSNACYIIFFSSILKGTNKIYLTGWSNILIYDILPDINLCMSELSEGSADVDRGEDIDQCPEGKYFSHQLCLECPSGH